MDRNTVLDETPLVEKNTSIGPLRNGLVAEERSTLEFLVLTIPFFGLQLAWTVQQVFGVPYLASLGVSSSQMPIFVLSGPLAGLVGPPVVAALSETCQSPWGKRKPFIFFGGLGTILSFLLLSAAQPLAVTLALNILDLGSSSAEVTTSHIIAGVSLYALNFSIQPLQLGLRASVVDHFGPHQQPAASLWISCFSVLGSVFVALIGLIYSPTFWDLSAVVTCVLSLLLGVVTLTNAMKPDSQWSEKRNDAEPISPFTYVSRQLEKAWHLPPITQRTCQVQLVSWFAWFLVLNYTSTLTSYIYNEPNGPDVQVKSASTPTSTPMRAVSRVALLFHSTALVTLVTVSIIWRRFHNRNDDAIPWLEADANGRKARVPYGSRLGRMRDILMPWVWATLSMGWRRSGYRHDYAKTQLEIDIDKDETVIRYDDGLDYTCDVLIRQVWKPCLAALATSLIGTSSLVGTAKSSSQAATAISLLLGANGILFALANWVPYTLIAYEASAQARSRAMMAAEGDTVDDEDDTPRLLAVHNIAITVPQIVASMASWLLMQGLVVLGLEQDVVWIFVLCIPSALWAAWL